MVQTLCKCVSSFIPTLSPHYNSGILKYSPLNPQRASVVMYSLCYLIPCLPSSYQELKCQEIKVILEERIGEQEEGENV